MTPPAVNNSTAKVHDIEDRPSSFLYVLFISSVAAIGGFLFGFDSGVINGTVTALGRCV